MSWWCVWAQVKALVKKNIFWRSWLLVVGFYTEAKFQVMTWCKVSRLSRLVVEGPFPSLHPSPLSVLTPLDPISLQQVFPSASLRFMVLIRQASTQSPPLKESAEWLESNENTSNWPRQSPTFQWKWKWKQIEMDKLNLSTNLDLFYVDVDVPC